MSTNEQLLGELSAELNLWQEENNLPHECAQEQLLYNDSISEQQSEWLKGFCDRWDSLACE